ncbi:MAG: tRNA (cytidine(34)-2'-O)-methyltransferase [Sphingomonas sp.]|nr:tRNA (cytidine(34)-2'-O)-methyltransferase [Sphingomonas sp.]
MRIALYQPDIAGNVGTIIRMAACFDLPVDLIEPMGFAWGDRALSRAGMDYAASARVTRHADWAAFLSTVSGRIALLTTRGATRLDATIFQPDDILLLGAESSGVPPEVHDRADTRVIIPLVPGLRSLNVAVAAAIATGEALRQINGWPADQPI